jgi:hypothetical protein
MGRLLVPLTIAVSVLTIMAAPAAAQQTGMLSGVVKDSQGAVLPGVTVTVASEALIGGDRSTVTGEAGSYQFSALPPGLYTVSYVLAGFQTLRREAIRVQVAVVTRLDVELAVGALQETVTVSGDSPVVDVTSTVTQTNITKEIYETIPTGRNPWVMAGLVPGVVTGRLDVGGTEGMQQYNLEVFGSADSQKSFSIDGLKTNWPGGNGGATMQYYGFEMYEEYNMQTASGTAESDVSGVYMNMVTRSGGNRFSSEHNLYFMNESLQSENVDDDLRRRLGLQAGAQTGAAGNPIDVSYDWSSTIGGPILRDKVWFFGGLRWWRLDQFQIGAVNPDGTQAIDDNRIRNFMGKLTYQIDSATRTSFLFNRNLKDRFHRRDAPYLFVEDKATVLQDQPAQNFVGQVNRVIGQSAVLDVRFGRMWGVFPTRYQKEVGPDDISLQDVVRFQRFNAANENTENPNHRYQFNAAMSYFRDNLLGGTHDFKVGVQVSRERMEYLRNRNGDIVLELSDGSPFRVTIANTPINSDHRINTWGAFVQDQWRLRRITINAGVRLDGVEGIVPAQSSPAGTYVGERDFDEISGVPDFPLNAALRFGVSYDLFGTGKTALKAYYGRFYNQFGSEIPESVNPNGLATLTTTWSDANNNRRADPGELGAIPQFTRGVFPTMDPDATRPFSDEFNVGVDHTIVRDLSFSVSYHRRQHRDGLGIVDLARPTSAYTPVTRQYTDPFSGVQSITIYSLASSLVTARNRQITNVDVLESDYDGVQFNIVKRMSNRWQVLAGLTLQRHEGFVHNGTFTNPGSTTDFNNPNYVLNRDASRVFTDVPWVFNLSGTYQLPYDIRVSGKYGASAGSPQLRQLQVTGLNQSESVAVLVVPRGEDRSEVVNKFVDVRLAKRFDVGGRRIEGTLDFFNLLNANHVLLYNETVGTSGATGVAPLSAAFGRPTRILTPRIVRLGLTVVF